MPSRTLLKDTVGTQAILWCLALSACSKGGEPSVSGALTLSVAPLTLPGIDEACYTLEVANNNTGTSLVFSETNVCSTAYGNGKGDITYIGTCDAQVDADNNATNGIQNRVELQLTRLSGDVGTPGDLTSDDFVNPCGDDQCVLFANCVENTDTRVTFNLTVMRDADQGFFDIGVNFSDVFCSAKIDCRPQFLFNDQSQRGPTAVVAFACTAGDNGPTNIYLDDISLGATTYPIAGLKGNYDRNGGAPGGKYAVYKDQEEFSNYTKYFWNVAIDITDYTGPITTRGTASGLPLTNKTTPTFTRYPVIDFNVTITSGSCLANPLDGEQPNGQPSGVTTSYTSLSSVETFDNSYFDCAAGFHIESGVCVSNSRSCPVTNGAGTETWSGSWGPCTVTSCNSGFHSESNACVSNTQGCTIANGTGTQTWSGTWGTCTVVSCNAGFHNESNACVSDTRTCAVPNGSGFQVWLNGAWTTCTATACNTGYHIEAGACVAPGFQTGYLKASNTGTGDWFGYGIALSADGNTIAVGALLEDSASTGINSVPNEGAPDSGAVYVYTRPNASGTYTLEAYIKASNAGAGDGFGVAVSLSSDGNTLAVGARLEDSNTTGISTTTANSNNAISNGGAAYVYTRSAGVWSEQAYIKPSTISTDDQFAYSVSLSSDGNTLAVSCHGEDSSATGVNGNQANDNAVDSGAAFVFSRSGSTWTEEAYLKPSNTQSWDEFSGNQLAISADGNTLVIGSHREDGAFPGVNGNPFSEGASNSGAAYVFVRTGGIWSQEAYLKASNPGTNDGFGYNVAISGDGNTVAIASRFEDGGATTINGVENDAAQDAGAVYVFAKSNGTWAQQAYVKGSNTEAGDYFGGSVALSYDGNVLMAGGWQEDSSATGIGGDSSNNSAASAGAMYRFTRTLSAWAQSAYIKASNTEGGDLFGTWVAMTNDGLFAAVAALLESGSGTGFTLLQGDNSASQAGAVYLFNF